MRSANINGRKIGRNSLRLLVLCQERKCRKKLDKICKRCHAVQGKISSVFFFFFDVNTARNIHQVHSTTQYYKVQAWLQRRKINYFYCGVLAETFPPQLLYSTLSTSFHKYFKMEIPSFLSLSSPWRWNDKFYMILKESFTHRSK